MKLLSLVPSGLLLLLGLSEVVFAERDALILTPVYVVATGSAIALLGFLAYRMTSKTPQSDSKHLLSLVLVIMAAVAIVFGVASILMQVMLNPEQYVIEPVTAFSIFMVLGLVESSIALIEWDSIYAKAWSIGKTLSTTIALTAIPFSAWFVFMLLFFVRFGAS